MRIEERGKNSEYRGMPRYSSIRFIIGPSIYQNSVLVSRIFGSGFFFSLFRRFSQLFLSPGEVFFPFFSLKTSDHFPAGVSCLTGKFLSLAASAFLRGSPSCFCTTLDTCSSPLSICAIPLACFIRTLPRYCRQVFAAFFDSGNDLVERPLAVLICYLGTGPGPY